MQFALTNGGSVFGPRFWIKLHFGAGLLWTLLIAPTMIWWSNSILWVAFMSLYANIAGHWAAAQAAQGDLHNNGDTGAR